jgi:hypothetical protein
MQQASMRMNWELGPGPGSARFTWKVEGATIQIGTTYLADGLASMLHMAADLSLGASASLALLVAEPGGHRIFCSGATDTVFVQVVSFEDFGSPETWWKDAELKWHGRVRVADVVGSVRAMAGDVLERHGVDGYRKLWGLPFPMTEYRSLTLLLFVKRCRATRQREFACLLGDSCHGK